MEVELLELVGTLELEELVTGGGVCDELLELVEGGGVFDELLDVEDELLEFRGCVEELLEDVGFEDEELLMVCFQVAVMSEVYISRRILASNHVMSISFLYEHLTSCIAMTFGYVTSTS